MQWNEQMEEAFEQALQIYPNLRIKLCLPEDKIFCTACEESYQTDNNKIVLCKLCNVPVHIYCNQGDLVKILKEDQKDWCCESCTYILNQIIEGKTVKKMNCKLCPQNGMVMRQYQIYYYKNCYKLWAHICCLTNVKYLRPIKDGIYQIKNLEQLQNMTDVNCCCFCKSITGHVVQCALEECDKRFHTGCAKFQGMLIDSAGMQLIRSSFDKEKIRENCGLFCVDHVEEKYENLKAKDKVMAKVFKNIVLKSINYRLKNWYQPLFFQLKSSKILNINSQTK